MKKLAFICTGITVILLAFSSTVSAATIEIFDVKAKKTVLERGEVFEAQLQTAEINENMTINLVFDGAEYLPADGGGACRSDNGLFLGWIEDGEHPVARILCTMPLDAPENPQKIELVAYQFRDCDDGGTRCSMVTSSQVITLKEDEEEDSDETPEANITPDTGEDIRERIEKEKPILEALLESLFGGRSGDSNDEEENNDAEDGNEDENLEEPPETQPPTTISFADCKRHSSPTLKYTCQLYNEIKQKCTTYKPGQVLPENKACLNKVTALGPNARANAIVNADQDYSLAHPNPCPNGQPNRSRGYQCMGFAQNAWMALHDDSSYNVFSGLNGVGAQLIADGDVQSRFRAYPISECKNVAKVGEPIWFGYEFHITIGSFTSSDKREIEVYEGNFDYCGTVNTRKMGTGWPLTHCFMPKDLQ